MLGAFGRQRDVRSQAVCIGRRGGLQEVGVVSSEGGRQGLEWVSRGDLYKTAEGMCERPALPSSPSLTKARRGVSFASINSHRFLFHREAAGEPLSWPRCHPLPRAGAPKHLFSTSPAPYCNWTPHPSPMETSALEEPTQARPKGRREPSAPGAPTTPASIPAPHSTPVLASCIS